MVLQVLVQEVDDSLVHCHVTVLENEVPQTPRVQKVDREAEQVEHERSPSKQLLVFEDLDELTVVLERRVSLSELDLLESASLDEEVHVTEEGQEVTRHIVDQCSLVNLLEADQESSHVEGEGKLLAGRDSLEVAFEIWLLPEEAVLHPSAGQSLVLSKLGTELHGLGNCFCKRGMFRSYRRYRR